MNLATICDREGGALRCVIKAHILSLWIRSLILDIVGNLESQSSAMGMIRGVSKLLLPLIDVRNVNGGIKVINPTDNDEGRLVKYTTGGDGRLELSSEYGRIYSFSDKYVFVQFEDGRGGYQMTPQACSKENLEWCDNYFQLSPARLAEIAKRDLASSAHRAVTNAQCSVSIKNR